MITHDRFKFSCLFHIATDIKKQILRMSGFFKLVIYCRPTYKYFLKFVVCLSFVPFIRQAYERSQYIQVSTQP